MRPPRGCSGTDPRARRAADGTLPTPLVGRCWAHDALVLDEIGRGAIDTCNVERLLRIIVTREPSGTVGCASSLPANAVEDREAVTASRISSAVVDRYHFEALVNSATRSPRLEAVRASTEGRHSDCPESSALWRAR